MLAIFRLAPILQSNSWVDRSRYDLQSCPNLKNLKYICSWIYSTFAMALNQSTV